MSFEHRDDLPVSYYCLRCGQQLNPEFNKLGGICSTCVGELELRRKNLNTSRCPDCGRQAKQYEKNSHVCVCVCGCLFDKEAIEAEEGI